MSKLTKQQENDVYKAVNALRQQNSTGSKNNTAGSTTLKRNDVKSTSGYKSLTNKQKSDVYAAVNNLRRNVYVNKTDTFAPDKETLISERAGRTNSQKLIDDIADRQYKAAKTRTADKKKTSTPNYALKNPTAGTNKVPGKDSLYALTNAATKSTLPGTGSAVTTAAKKTNNSQLGQTLNNADMFKRAAELASKQDWTEEERKEADEILENFNQMAPENRTLLESQKKSTKLLNEDSRWSDLSEYLKTGYHNVLWKDPESIYDTTGKYSQAERNAAATKAAADTKNQLTIAENFKIDKNTPQKIVESVQKYTLMSDDQKRRYNEIYALYGRDAAEEYHNLLLNDINKKVADKAMTGDRDLRNIFGKNIYMFSSGVESAGHGLEELAKGLAGNDKREAASVRDYVASNLRNDKSNSKLQNVAYDIEQSTGYMAPGLLLSGGLGTAGVGAKAAGAAGNILFGLSQAGNTYRDDINAGRNVNSARLHAAQAGIDETATNWLLGGINAFGGGALKNALGNTKTGQAIANGITGLAKTNTGKVILQRVSNALADMGGEAAQEYLQFYTENFTNNMLYGNTESMDLLDPDAWYAAGLGALNALVLNMPGNVSRTVQGIKTDVSFAAETAQSLDLDRSHYKTDEDFEKVETLKGVAEEVAKKVADGTVTAADKIAYNEAVADVLSSEANTEYNDQAIAEDEEQVNVQLLPVNYDESAPEVGKAIDESNKQWEKILTNPKLTSIASTDGSTSYSVERNGDKLLFTQEAGGAVQSQQEYNIDDIGKGGDADILTVMPIQGISESQEIPQLTTFVNYKKGGTKLAEKKDTIVDGVDNVDNSYGLDDKTLQNIRKYKAETEPESVINAADAGSYVTKENFPEFSKEYSAELATKESTDHMISLWHGRNASEYLSAYKRVYTAGFNNIDQETAQRAITNSYLTPEQWQQAYKDGLKDGEARRNARKQQEFKAGEKREGGITKGAEKVDEDTRKFLGWVGERTGLKIQIAEGLKGEAEINVEKGIMRINPYAKDFVGSTAHELTHMIRIYAPKEYETLERLTIEALMKSREMDYETLYESYEREYRKDHPEYTTEDIIEEMVADGATAYMNDTAFAERVAKADRSLAKKIADFFKGIADTLKKIINEKGIRAVGKVMRENEARFRMAANIWFSALEVASERYREGYTIESTSDGTRFMLNIDEKDITDEYIEKNFQTVRDMNPVAELTGEEFNFGVNTKDEIIKYYDSIGNSSTNKDAGAVDLTRRFVKDVLGHKINRRKYIMMAAVPDIISNGEIIDYTKAYKTDDEDRITIAAPFSIQGNTKYNGDYYGLVTVKVFKDHNRAYIVNYAFTEKEASSALYTRTRDISISGDLGADVPPSIGSIIERLVSGNYSVENSAEKEQTRSQTNEDPGKRLKSDSEGRTLTEAQSRYFANSKVVDANGNLKVMYRGGNAEINVFDRKKSSSGNLFGRGFYFTAEKSHASTYGNVSEYYLNITNPLNNDKLTFTNKEIKKFLEAVAENEDYSIENYGTYDIAEIMKKINHSSNFALIQDINATAIGDLVAATELFNEVNGTSYDGFILPTETVVFSSNQIKSINNENPTEDSDIRFQLGLDPVEYTRDLIAVRNVSTDNLASMLELEGMPSPSIAITKADLGHTQFGNVSFIFGRSTIDPEADRRNMVFTADAWTPTYDQLGVDTEIVSDKLHNIRDKFYAYSRENAMFKDTLPNADNFGDKLRKYKGDLHEMADNSYDWKLLYLNDKGDPYKLKEETIIKPYSDNASNEEVIRLADTELRDMVEQYMVLPANQQKEYVDQNAERIADIYKDITGRDLFEGLDGKILLKNIKKRIRSENVLNGVLNYVYEAKTSYTSIDYDAAKKEIDEKIDAADYHAWVDENLKGVIGRKGIRNDKDTFTDSGNRRTFNQLHDKYTAANIVKALWKNPEQGVSSFGAAGGSARTLRGAAAGKMEDVAAMHERSDLLQSDTASNVNAAIDEADSRLQSIYKQIAERRTGAWSISWEQSYSEAAMQAATKAGTSAKVREYFSKENIRITDEEAKQLLDIFDKLRKLPTDYFEAKSKRVVGFDEIQLAIVPDDIDAALIDKLKEKGVARIETYPAGDDAARLEIENKAEDLRFQLGLDPGAVYDKEQRKNNRSNDASQKRDYTFSQYNRYGWAYGRGLLNKQNAAEFFNGIRDIKNGYNVRTSSEGQYMIETASTANGPKDTIIYTDGDYEKPTVEKVIKIKANNETEAASIKRIIYAAEGYADEQISLDSTDVGSLEQDGFIKIHDKSDSPSFKKYRESVSERGIRGEGISDNKERSNGRGSDRAAEGYRSEGLNSRQQLEEAEYRSFSDNMVRESSKELQDAADTLGELLSTVDYMPSDKAIERTAKRLKKYTETDTSIEEISAQLKTIFNYIAYNKKIDGASISDIAADYAGELISNSSKLKVDPEEQALYRRYRNAIKGYTFHMPEGFEGEVNALGGMRNLRRRFFGTLKITKNKGISIDSMYQELAELYPDMFDADRANPADQLEDIVDHLSKAPQPTVSYKTDAEYEVFRYYAGQEIFKAYIAEGAAEAGARSEYNKLKQDFNRKMKESAKTEKEMAGLQEKAAEMQARYLSELEASKKKVTRQTMNERVEKARKSTKLRYHKNEIIKDAKTLSRWLLKPTDANHVPESLRVPLANFLQQVDFSSKENLANGDPTQRTLLWKELQAAWAKVAANGGVAEDGNGTQYIEIDPDIVDRMQDLTAKVKDMKRMEDLDYIGVLQLSDILKSMKHSIENANKLLSTTHYRTVAQAAENTIAELGRIDTRTDYTGNFLGTFQKLFNNSMLDSATRFHTFGQAAEDIYKGLRRSFNKKIQRTAEAEKAFKEILSNAGVTSKDINKWSKETLSIDGKELTVAQVMSLYELMQRNQARDHILVGGITSSQVRVQGSLPGKLSGIKTQVRNKTGNMKVTQGDVLALIDKLTPEQKKVADGITAFFQKTAQWGNSAAMEMYGYKKFNDPHYFPIKVDSNYLTTTSDAAALNSNAVAIKNMGMTKSTVPHANNPLILSDIFDVFTDQVNDMSNYEAFLVPLSDLQKWYNYKADSIETNDRYDTSIKKELERVYGKEAQQYINKLMQNINGMKDGESYLFKPLISAFKGSAVGANLSVAIQQPTSYARAMAVIDPKYLMQAMTTKSLAGSWEDIKKYSAIANWKDWGFYETDIGRTMKNILTDPDTLLDKAKELQMIPAAKGDEITWKRLWVASELKVKAEKPDLYEKARFSETDISPETEKARKDFFSAVSEVFDDVIDRTQVVDSVFHRTDIMRSNNDLTLMATSFMAEPMKSYNMLYRAVYDYKTAKDAASRKTAGVMLTRSGMAFILSNALAAMAKSVITAMRDKDEDRDETFWNRWAAHTWDEFKGNVEPWNYVPGIKDIISIFQGYDVARTDMSGFQDLYYVLNRWKKYFEGNASYTLPNNILYSTKALSTFTGLAAYGFQRDVNAVIDTAIEAFGADELHYQKQKALGKKMGNKSNTGYYIGMAMKAYKDGNTKLGDKIISDMLDAGIEQDTIDSKMKTLAKEETLADDELNSLLDEAAAGKSTDLSDYKEKLKKSGYSDEVIDTTIESRIGSYMDDNGLSYAGLNEELNKISDYTSTGFKDYKELYTRWSNMAKLKNGWDDEKCRDAFRSQCTKYFKPLYKAGNAKERSRILNILSRAKTDKGEKLYPDEKTIRKWGE